MKLKKPELRKLRRKIQSARYAIDDAIAVRAVEHMAGTFLDAAYDRLLEAEAILAPREKHGKCRLKGSDSTDCS